MAKSNLKILSERASRFAALGDPTRLQIVEELSRNQRHNISNLTRLTSLTRQAMTKHLRVLENAKIVRSVRDGRDNLFELESKSMGELEGYLALISAQWDGALARLKEFVE